ncbi:MAG TPA: methionyl-tRNA formyltransferase [Acidimicrobiales bacterium]|nr:methionyl-tRNA formyltransferase [Acidimicrobiales bacterium]
MARLAYLGSPPAAVAPLESLVAAGHEVALVVSRADTRRGRGSTLQPSAVKAAAQGLGLAVSDRLDDVLEVGAELAVVVAYGKIVPPRVLDALDMINVHFSLLPRWRGAAPVERAILAGDAVTGVCVMRLEAGLDTGPVLARDELAIGADEHAGALVERLSAAGAALVTEVLAGGVEGLGPGEAQEGEPTYAAKLDPGEFRLDWEQPAGSVQRVVRLDRAWTTFRGERLRVLDSRVGEATAAAGDPVSPPAPGRMFDAVGGEGTGIGEGTGPTKGPVVGCGSGWLELVSVQPAGKKPMGAADWRRGVRPEPGERLGDEGPAAG